MPTCADFISRQKHADDARISISTLEKALSGRRPFTLTTTIRLEEALALIPEKRLAAAMPYGRITPGMPAFAGCRAMLAQVGDEGCASVFTCPD